MGFGYLLLAIDLLKPEPDSWLRFRQAGEDQENLSLQRLNQSIYSSSSLKFNSFRCTKSSPLMATHKVTIIQQTSLLIPPDAGI